MTDKDTYLDELNKFCNDIYPDSEEEATAERMIRHSTARALWLMHSLDLGNYDRERMMTLEWARTLGEMQKEYDWRFALVALNEIDPAKADEVARDSWLAAATGDSYGEWLWELAIESDIPVPPDTLDGKTQAEVKAEMMEAARREAALELDAQEVRTVFMWLALGESLTPDDAAKVMADKSAGWDEQRSKVALNHAYFLGYLEVEEIDGERRVRLAHQHNQEKK